MPTATASGPDRRIALLLPLATLALCACAPADEGSVEDGEARCLPDADDGPEDALELDPSGETSGQVCPVEDEDWIRFTVPPDQPIVRLSLGIASARSPVEPVYSIWATEGGAPTRVVATPPEGATGEITHCVGPGEFFATVRDLEDDAEDLRNRYTLTLSTAPELDALEPNGDEASATPLAPGTELEGRISCSGDADYFAVSGETGHVLRVRLDMPVSGMQPALRILRPDGEPLFSGSNPAGAARATVIEVLRVLPATGTYLVVISDDDGLEADPDVAYRVLAETVDDPDGNEPNDHPRDATPLGTARCGADWSAPFEGTGTIGSPGDEDWYSLPLSGCEGGILEAELTVHGGGLDDAAAWELQREVQAALQVVRVDPSSPCSEDGSCRTLQRACSSDMDCAGYFEACSDEGLCTGATVCAPGALCGATQIERHYDALPVPGAPTSAPPPNVAQVAIPVLDGDDQLYVRVSDYRSDGGRAGALYTLRVRARLDPDPSEAAGPNNVYVSRLTTDVPIEEGLSRATPIPVHRCTAGDCCGSGTWVEGSISYENDLDWLRYEHPCPGRDCMVRVHYELADGPVSAYLGIHTGDELWYSRDMSAGTSGTLGGLGAADSCFYAYQGHGAPYHVLVRDIAEPTRDWSADQRWRLCVEVIADACQSPCRDYGATGCGQP